MDETDVEAFDKFIEENWGIKLKSRDYIETKENKAQEKPKRTRKAKTVEQN